MGSLYAYMYAWYVCRYMCAVVDVEAAKTRGLGVSAQACMPYVCFTFCGVSVYPRVWDEFDDMKWLV